jgi:cysteine-rich repeat protein
MIMTACLPDGAVECSDGTLCPAGQACAPEGGACVEPSAVEACDGAADLTACAVPGLISDGVCAGQVCVTAGCGNGVVEADEVCDDGGQVDGDGCSRGCDSVEACGNQVVDAGEQCDDGNASDEDGCRADCTIVACGDGVIDALRGEACDAGAANSNAPDAPCRLTCQLPRCGDGIADTLAGEVCDDGNPLAGDGCRPDCRSTGACGNGVVDAVAGESCDDGNQRSRDGCSAACTDETIGWRSLGAATPPARQWPVLAYDAGRQRVVMFGGMVHVGGEDIYLSDTWEHDGAAWVQRAPAQAPPPRGWGVMAYDAARARTILFGGQSNDEAHLRDTWSWDGEAWTELTPATSPPGRLHTAMAYDAGRQRLVMFGGWTELAPDPIAADTWEFDGTTWLDVTPAGSPPARYLHGMAYDPLRAHVVIFGGGQLPDVSYEDTWTWDGDAWTEVAGPGPGSGGCGTLAFDGSRVIEGGCANTTWGVADVWAEVGGDLPMPRYYGNVAYDAARGHVLLFGGGGDGAERDDAWRWNGATWSLLPPPPTPAARHGAMVTYDAARARVVLFGGSAQGDAGGLLADTWELVGERWEARSPATSPSARREGMLAYDTARRRVVLFGGTTDDGPVADTWEWDGTTWVGRAPLASPPARSNATMVFDEARQVTVLTGGATGDTGLSDTWEYDGTTWTAVDTATAAPAVRGATMVFDPIEARCILFGGDTGDGYTDATWAYDGADWQQLAVAGAPPPRGFAVGGFDPVRRRVVVISGDRYDELQDDVREFDGVAWNLLSVPGAERPPGRTRAAGAYDLARSRFVLVGGLDAPPAEPGTPLVDTWALGYVAQAAGEACAAGFDVDDDGLVGCDDDDCWGVCAPMCPPTADPLACPSAPVCGDGACGDVEDCRTCPQDCLVGVACDVACGDFFCDDGEDAAGCPGDCAS